MNRRLAFLLAVVAIAGASAGRAEAAIDRVAAAGTGLPHSDLRPPDEQREILLLFSEDLTQPWTQHLAEGFGEVAMRHSSAPVLYYEYLDVARFRGADHLDRMRDWLKAKYAGRNLDIIIPLGEPAMAFVAKYRNDLWPGAGVFFLALRPPDDFFRQQLADAGGVVLEDNLPGTLVVMKTVLPGLRRVAVLRGTSQSERAWGRSVPEIVADGGLEFVDVPPMPVPSLLDHVRTLPANSVLLVLGPLVDTTGRVSLITSLCSEISSAASVPTIMQGSHFLGCGVIGGVMRDFKVIGERLATDVLGGNDRALHTVAVLAANTFSSPMFDARQLERWHVPIERLPAGSRVFYSQPNLWRDYRPHVIAAVAAIVLQTALIGGLLYQRRRRHAAEQASRRDLEVAARAARVTSMGELTASIAHELAQPLGAILHNVEAAKMMLGSSRASIEEIVEILEDVSRQDLRAREILTRIRMIVQKRELESAPVDLDAVVEDSVLLVAHEAAARGVVMQRELSAGSAFVFGDRVHLQQVVVNLLLNAMEAMAGTARERRRVLVQTTSGPDGVELSVSDSGPGLEAHVAEHLFEPFITTKPQGLGIGLSIARSIVTAHGGDIRLVNEPGGGVTARVTLPAHAAAAA